MQLNVRGKGNAGPFNGVPGDLMVVIEEIEHPELKRDGDNVHYEAVVSFMDAVLGASVEVPTISGKAKIKVEPGTQSGKVLRLREGLVQCSRYGSGDMFVHINIWTPTKLTKKKEIIEQLKDSENLSNPENKDKGLFAKCVTCSHDALY